MHRAKWLPVLLVLVLAASLATLHAHGEAPGEQLATELLAEGGGARLSYHDGTGLARFYAAGPEALLKAQAGGGDGLEPAAVAEAFLGRYGRLFGVQNAGRELSLERRRDLGVRSVLRYRQVHRGVPVLAGELVVHVAGGRVTFAGGEMAPVTGVATEPEVPAAAAREVALTTLRKGYGLDPEQLLTTEPQLWLYSPALLGAGPSPARLAWGLEVTAPEALDLRHLLLIDAQTGAVLLQFDQTTSALSRRIYDNDQVAAAGLPGMGPVRGEGQAAVGVIDADLAYDYSGHVYNYYWANHGRDSIDDAGMELVSTVRYCTALTCPYANAFWNGRQMVYGIGMVADDVVAHEITHAVTQHESNLLYLFQMGAINESLSDIWGELIDLSNGAGNDSPEVRWLVGEDLTIGAIRSMKDPTDYGHPDRLSSPYYDCDPQFLDNGGVHTNSGVLNKAAYLIVDGGSFNGYSVSGVGETKAAQVFYELQTNLLTAGSDFRDLYDLLPQACTNLMAGSVTTAGDCQQVSKAVQATEMNRTPAPCAAAAVPVCPAGQTCRDLFYDDMENTATGNWAGQVVAGSYLHWYYPQNSHTYNGFDATYTSSGGHNLWGDAVDGRSSSAVAMTRGVRLPAGASSYLHFQHAHAFERWQGLNCDGGVVEYSIDGGGTWNDVGWLPVVNGYNGTLDQTYGAEYYHYNNPLMGRAAFVGGSGGYLATRIDITALAGNDVRFRFRTGTDAEVGHMGWFVDDVRIATTADVPPTATPTVVTSPTVAASPTITATPSRTPTPTPTPIRRFLPVAQRNWAQQRLPNDPYYSLQWNMTAVRAPVAWGANTGGSGPIIAVLDTGVSLNHPDLKANIIWGWDFVNNDGYADDDHGHGTHVAGIAAAAGNNGLGVAGVSWQARLMPVKILDYRGMGYPEDAQAAMHWAVDQGARVLNLSFGTMYASPFLEEAVAYARSRGVVVVAAAGNVGGDSGLTKGTTMYPAAYEGVIVVGATDSGDRVTYFSNDGPFLDVTAPGASILSTVPGGYNRYSGTSMATPHVSGLAGLVWAAHPQLTAAQVATAIMATAKDLGTAGWDPSYGYGLIDAGKAVLMAPQVAATELPARPALSALGQPEPVPGAYRPGAVLVRLAPGKDARALVGVAPDALRLARQAHPDMPGLLRLPVAEGEEAAMLARLAALPEVEAVYLDAILFAMH